MSAQQSLVDTSLYVIEDVKPIVTFDIEPVKEVKKNTKKKNFNKKRDRYKNPTYRKSYKNDVIDEEQQQQEAEKQQQIKDDTVLWGGMNNVYAELANYFTDQIPFGSCETVFDLGFITLWKQEYTNKSYMYYGKRYKEVPHNFLEAEVKGTENLPIDERLKIHSKFLEILKQDYTIYEALNILKNCENECKILKENLINITNWFIIAIVYKLSM